MKPATYPQIRSAKDELQLKRSIMRCYALSWKEHRNGMAKQAEIELKQAVTRRDEAQEFEKD